MRPSGEIFVMWEILVPTMWTLRVPGSFHAGGAAKSNSSGFSEMKDGGAFVDGISVFAMTLSVAKSLGKNSAPVFWLFLWSTIRQLAIAKIVTPSAHAARANRFGFFIIG